MAIYHVTTKPISRSNGHSATAKSAYISGEKITDNRTGEILDYTRKGGVIEHEIILPNELKLSINSNELWNKAEQAENRKDARVGREWEISLPHELNSEQRKILAQEITKSLADKYNVACQYALHNPSRDGDQRNYHVHILTTTRVINKDGSLGEKSTLELSNTKLDKLGLERSDKQITNIRASIAEKINLHLERANIQEKVSHLSLEAQGINKVATIHKGKAVTEMERRGVQTNVGNFNIEIQSTNKEINLLVNQVAHDGNELAKINAMLHVTKVHQAEQERKLKPEKEIQNRITGKYSNPLFNIAKEHGEFFTKKVEHDQTYYVSRNGDIEVHKDHVSVLKPTEQNINLALDVAIQKFGNDLSIFGDKKFIKNVIGVIAKNQQYNEIKIDNPEHQKQLEQERKSLLLNQAPNKELDILQRVKQHLEKTTQTESQEPKSEQKHEQEPRQKLDAVDAAKQYLADLKDQPRSTEEILQDIDTSRQEKQISQEQDYSYSMEHSR